MTIHRAYGYVDRAAVREGSPLRVVMASEGRQADGIDLRMSGAQLDRFRANPVLGYGHSYWGRANLPIGRVDPVSIAVEGSLLAGDLGFDPADEFARTVERKMRDGFLNAVSIGFEVTKWEDDKGDHWRGGVAEQWELHELSVVPVPMDASAVVTAGRGDDDRPYEAAIRWLGEELTRRGLWPLPDLGEALQPPKPNDSPPPPAAGVPDAAARTLLAAFDSKESHA